MTVYLDVVWLLNFLVDMMLLLLTKSLLRMDTHIGRIVLGAFIASIIVPISILFPGTFLTTVIGKILFSMVIIVCTFKTASFFQFLSSLATFYFVTFVIGGGLIGIHFLLQQHASIQVLGVLQVQNGYGEPISWLFVVICFPIVYYFTHMRMDKHVESQLEYDQLCEVTIQIKKKQFQTTGFIDSGNNLIDPITSFSVIICDHHFLKQWFTRDEWQQLEEAHKTLAFDKIPEHWERNIHIVPYQGVGGKRSFLMALRPEKVTIQMSDHQITTNKVLIGMQFAQLTPDQTYHCLLHPYIIQKAPVQSA